MKCVIHAVGVVPARGVTGRRRLVFGAAGAVAIGAMPVRAQTTAPARVGLLSGGTREDAASFLPSLLQGLRDLGLRDGDNLRIEARFPDYSASRAESLAAELAGLKPALIVANGGGISPAYRLSPPVPLVFLQSGDPVDAGMADSYARPGRHATGVTLMALDLIVKRLDLLKQFSPRIRRVAFLASPEHAGQRLELAASRAAAQQVGVDVGYYEARNPTELQQALARVAADRPDAALLFSDALMVSQRQPLAAFFMQHRIPSAAGWAGFPESGHVMSYGPLRQAAWRRVAYFVDRILKGARPADLPIELPTEFELVINRQTATAMNLVLTSSMFLRADRVID